MSQIDEGLIALRAAYLSAEASAEKWENEVRHADSRALAAEREVETLRASIRAAEAERKRARDAADAAERARDEALREVERLTEKNGKLHDAWNERANAASDAEQARDEAKASAQTAFRDDLHRAWVAERRLVVAGRVIEAAVVLVREIARPDPFQRDEVDAAADTVRAALAEWRAS